MFRVYKLLAIYVVILLFTRQVVLAQENSTQPVQLSYTGVVSTVVEENRTQTDGWYQKLEISIMDKDLKGQVFIVEHGFGDSPVTQKFGRGDKVVLTGYKDQEGNTNLFVTDYIRTGQLAVLFILFIALAVVVGGKKGLTSFLGMVLTFGLIFIVVLPQINRGVNPTLIILFFALVVVPITFYLSHGVSAKTTVAIIGTFITLLITVILSAIFVASAKLTGFTNDEASFVQLLKGGTINMQGILLAGIIVGFLGVLDDITVSQASIVFKLKEANKRLTFSDLYKRSMDVGKDHIASMINTLVLVYTGAFLPLLLLFLNSSKTFSEVVNYEIIATEIIRTLLGSIGLISAVPITTVLASLVADSASQS